MGLSVVPPPPERLGQSLPDVRVPPPGPGSRQLAARLSAVESPSFDARRAAREQASGEGQAPIVYATGLGANVIDVDGNRYVDLAAGFGALSLGHSPPRVAGAIDEQRERLWLALGDVYASDAKVVLCERLARLAPWPRARVMLGSTGADAVTAAIKTAMLATGKAGIVAFEGAYHGLSHGPLAACGLKPSFRLPFAEQLSAHVIFAPYPYDDASLEPALAAVGHALARGDVGAVLVEPILGRGGCVVPPSGFLPALRRVCDGAGALLVCDEIWTGCGRSGARFASVAAGVLADVLCIGKGLGAGMPISACLASESAASAWGSHGGSTLHTATHFGAPLACAAAVAALDVIEEEGLAERALKAGARWMDVLRAKTSGLGVAAVRGQGLMVGVGLAGGEARTIRVVRLLLARGWIVLTGGAEGDVLTLTPPLDIDDALLDAFAGALADVLAAAP